MADGTSERTRGDDSPMTSTGLRDRAADLAVKLRDLARQPLITDDAIRSMFLAMDTSADCIDELLASPAPAGAEGWVLVPLEPTQQWMDRLANLRQGQSPTPRCEPPTERDVKVCRALIAQVLAAAPTPPHTAPPFCADPQNGPGATPPAERGIPLICAYCGVVIGHRSTYHRIDGVVYHPHCAELNERRVATPPAEARDLVERVRDAIDFVDERWSNDFGKTAIAEVRKEVEKRMPVASPAPAQATPPAVCHVCGEQTETACADCQITFSATVYVCSKASCRDAHERKCFGPGNSATPPAEARDLVEDIKQRAITLLDEIGAQFPPNSLSGPDLDLTIAALMRSYDDGREAAIAALPASAKTAEDRT